MKSKYLRDHVSGYGKDVKKATNDKFGVNNSLILKAAMGDEKALTQIADMGKLGERLSMALPTIKEHLKAYIQGNTAYNQTLAELYKEGGKGALQITKAGSDLSLENTRFNNFIEEYKQQLEQGLQAENTRHGDTMDTLKLQAWVDSQMKDVDQQAKLEGITNKPYTAQMKADVDYENRKVQHILENGSNSNLELLPRKQYVTNPIANAWQGIREFFS